MSVQNQTVKNVYAGNGSTTVFPFTFALLESDGEYVSVYVTNDADISEKTTNFEINATAKTVTYPKIGEPLPAGKKIVIRREIPNEQELNLENLGPFFAEDVEGEFDREVMMIQQLQEEADRSIKVDPASDTKPEELIAELFEASADAVAAAEAAKTSENNAAASETAAGNSAAAAALSETAAGNSATAANNSKIAAAASETNAGNSASAAANSATAAYNSQVAAAASETAAGNSATAAGDSATNAGNSATAAHNSQVAAKASEDAAAESAQEAAGINYLIRKNSTAYTEGAVAFAAAIPSPLVLECKTAGTTAATAPDFSGAVEGGTVTDGTVVWTYSTLVGGGLDREQIPAFNHRDVITTSGTYTAPVSGWYKITVKGGGGGGGGGYLSQTSMGGGGGGEGGTTIAYEYMTAGDTATVVIGAGGNGGPYNVAGTDGGNSTVTVNSNTYTGGGGTYGGSQSTLTAQSKGGNGGSGTIPGAPGGSGQSAYANFATCGGSGGGSGGGWSSRTGGVDGTNGSGGGGGAGNTDATSVGKNGGDGYVWFEYFAEV